MGGVRRFRETGAKREHRGPNSANRSPELCRRNGAEARDCGRLLSGRRKVGACELAEREGFEPSVRLPVQRFSRPSRSTTPAPLRGPILAPMVVGSGTFIVPVPLRQLAARIFAAQRWRLTYSL